MSVLEIKNLDKSFDNKKIIDNVSFNIEKGKIVGLLGKNGSGKSTLLKILMGKEIPDNGKVIINKDIQVVLFALIVCLSYIRLKLNPYKIQSRHYH